MRRDRIERQRAHVRERTGATPPEALTDHKNPDYRPWTEGYDPGTWLDRAVHATRTAVFPLHGLDPLP